MASSSKLCHTASVSNTGAPALPLDVLFDVLLLLPAKDLCRFRAVCRSWCALTKDPHFVAEHKSRHTEPLFAVTFSHAWGVAIVGLSGQPIRRIPALSNIEVLETHLDRLCAFGYCKPELGAWVLNPATAAAGALALPGLQHSDEFLGICRHQISVGGFLDFIQKCWEVTYAFGQVASTREYKVLRFSHPKRSPPLLCDIITLDGSNQERWRRKQNTPSSLIGTRRRYIRQPVTVNGVVYFLLDYAVMEPASTAPFNLDTEKWMPTLRGPEPLRSAEFWDFDREIALANLNDSLVIIDNDLGVFDLWFLMDHNIGLWVKKYRLNIGSSCIDVRPLLILDDGRIVIYDRGRSMLQCYDPTTPSFSQKRKRKKTTHSNVLDFMEMGHGSTESIAVYTGSLLI